MKNKTLITILRWIAVLPAAVLGAILVNAIAIIFQYIETIFIGAPINDGSISIVEIMQCAIRNGFFGAAFVAAGWYVAPNYKNVVKIVLTTTLVLLNIILAAMYINGFANTNWETWVGIVFSIIGSIVVNKYLNEPN